MNRTHRWLFALLISLVSGCCLQRVNGQVDTTWGNNVTGNWSFAPNWSNGVPELLDTAIIGTGESTLDVAGGTMIAGFEFTSALVWTRRYKRWISC